MSTISILGHGGIMCAIIGSLVGANWLFQTLHQAKLAAGNPTIVYELMGFLLNCLLLLSLVAKALNGRNHLLFMKLRLGFGY
jgi:hypothetical protein